MNTELFRSRLPDMQKDELVKIISITSAYIAVGVSLFMWAQVSGLEKGYFFGVFKDQPIMSGFGPSYYYQDANRWYCAITAGFCLYIAGKLLKPSFVSNILCVSFLSIIVLQFVDMFVNKWYWLSYTSRLNKNAWVQNSIYFNYFLIVVAVSLMVSQFALINKRKTDSVTLKIV